MSYTDVCHLEFCILAAKYKLEKDSPVDLSHNRPFSGVRINTDYHMNTSAFYINCHSKFTVTFV